MNKYLENLSSHILELSEAKNFNDAKKEWVLDYIEIAEELESCPCGHENIKDLCYIKNTLNGNTTFVGNVCVNKFVGIDARNLFTGVKRIREDIESNMNEDLIVYAEGKGWLKYGEYNFLLDTKRKRNLSYKQISWKTSINHRILKNIGIKEK